MKSSPDSPRPAQLSWLETPKPGKLIFSLTIPGRLPSWNDILGLEQWGRYKLKKEMADAFLSTLRATAKDSSIKTTYVASILLTYADTLESYLQMRLAQRKSKSAKKRLAKASQSAQPLKSTLYDNPPF